MGEYDRRHELIIDPVVEYMTYLGGAGLDPIQAAAVDPAGNAIVAGVTNSVNFPGLLPGSPAAETIFVSNFDPSGFSLLYTTFLGSRPDGLVNCGFNRADSSPRIPPAPCI